MPANADYIVLSLFFRQVLKKNARKCRWYRGLGCFLSPLAKKVLSNADYIVVWAVF